MWKNEPQTLCSSADKMVRKSGSLCSGLFFLLWICTQSSLAEDDLPCLAEFKNSVTDPLHYLANWDFKNASLPGIVCSWNGVQCWNDQENKVLSLNLSGAGLSRRFRSGSGFALRKCASITGLNLSSNSFTGPLPLDFCHQLPFLNTLDLSHNLFEGSIPPNLGNCSYLNNLSLQDNNLSGEIPWQLGDLPRLGHLDLSSNALSGRIPSNLLNRSFDAANFADNPLLCGWPGALSECPPAPNSPWKVLVLIGASLGLLLFIALALAFQWPYKLRDWLQKHFSERGSSSLHLFDTHLKLTWEEVQRATSCFSPANIVGSGGSSTVYRGRLLDGQEIAVKVLHNEELGSQLQHTPKQLFLTELRLLGKLRHRNLVKVLGFFCNSENMAIILDYMPAGSLDALLLHESATSNLAFGWKARLNILLGIAEGLAYLHNEYDGKLSVIHADLKPGNVLLDEHMEPHIADFGIATFVTTINNNCSVPSSKGQVLPMPCWSLGYTAPECVQQGLVSRKGDVFSFGVIVLEVITGERPSSNKLKEGESLAEWVSKALVEGVVEHVFAPVLSSAEETLRWKQDLSATLRMGCSCASIVHTSRPNMSEVVTFLRKICEKHEDTPSFQVVDLCNFKSLSNVP